MTNYYFPKNWKALTDTENLNIKSKNAAAGGSESNAPRPCPLKGGAAM